VSFDGYPVVDVVNVVLSVPSHEVLVVASFGELLCEEEGLHVLLVEHDELAQEGGVGGLALEEGLGRPLLVEEREILVVELVESAEFKRGALRVDIVEVKVDLEAPVHKYFGDIGQGGLF
jgi:hypothetical protein